MEIRFGHILIFGLIAVLLGCTSQSPGANQTGVTNMANNTTVSATQKEIAVLETSMGNVEIELNRVKAPITVENFVQYVQSGYYDGLVFHRVIKGFMIQGGGFSTDGSEKATRASIKLESNNGLHNSAGTIAMARTNDPNSATSQFFINIVDNPFLDYSSGNAGYAVFGKVVSGMDVVKAIEGVQTTTNGAYDDWPVQDVIIKRAYMKAN